MTDKTIGAIEALLNIGLGAGLLVAEPNKRKASATKVKAEQRRAKPRRPGEPEGHKVEVEDIGRGEHLPKDVPVSTEAGFSKDAWAKIQASKQRKVKGWE